MTSGVELDRTELVPQICERLTTGQETLTAICGSLGIARSTFNQWRREDPEIEAAAKQAKRDGCHAIADECMHISDTPLMGEECEYDAEGNLIKRKTCDMLGHRKLMIETRMNLLKKWMPDVYGDKTAIDHSSSDGSMTPKGLSDFYGGLNPPAKPADPDA